MAVKYQHPLLHLLWFVITILIYGLIAAMVFYALNHMCALTVGF